jgi:hypothetical protein
MAKSTRTMGDEELLKRLQGKPKGCFFMHLVTRTTNLGPVSALG